MRLRRCTSKWSPINYGHRDENIEAVERIVMCNQQISVRLVADELGIPKTSVHEDK